MNKQPKTYYYMYLNSQPVWSLITHRINNPKNPLLRLMYEAHHTNYVSTQKMRGNKP